MVACHDATKLGEVVHDACLIDGVRFCPSAMLDSYDIFLFLIPTRIA